MFKRKSVVYAFVVATLLTSAVFGAYAVNAQTGTTPTATPAEETTQTAPPFDPSQMAGTMTAMLDQMEAMMAAAPDAAARQQMAPALMNMLNGMMGLNQTLMEQMQSMPGPERQAMAGPTMEAMTRMTKMMGQMQPMMGSGMTGQGAPGMMGGSSPMTGTMSMTGTQSMGAMGGGMQMGQMMGMMGQMMQMMGQMHGMMGDGMMGQGAPGMMDGSSPMTGTMPMTGTQSMGAMGGGMQMGQMMGMMGQMMQMMGQMQSMMGGDMMGQSGPGMMDGSSPMTGTMPMTGTQSMGPMGGDMQMGQMMGQMMQMMQMMGQMHGMMGEGMMGGAGMGQMGSSSPMTGTTTTQTSPSAEAKTPVAGTQAPQSIEGGGVTVKVTPLSLTDDTATSLDFEVVLDTHSVELNYDVAQLAILRDNLGNEYRPAAWTPEQSGGHHVSGKLSFADRATILQTGITSLELDVTEIAGVPSLIFQWSVGK